MRRKRFEQWLTDSASAFEEKEVNPFTAEHQVVARGLRKNFESTEAVRDIDFNVRHGECFGFLGPNGAGKTRTMRMISCVRSTDLLRPT